MRLIGSLLDLLSHKVVSGIADTGVQVPIVGGVLGALDALAVDPHVAVLAEAAALVEILVESADGLDDGVAGLGGAAVDLVVSTGATSTVNKVVPEGADAGKLSL